MSQVNAGDLYLKLAHRHTLPKNLGLNRSVGVLLYQYHDDELMLVIEQSLTFNEVCIRLNKSLADTGRYRQMMSTVRMIVQVKIWTIIYCWPELSFLILLSLKVRLAIC